MADVAHRRHRSKMQSRIMLSAKCVVMQVSDVTTAEKTGTGVRAFLQLPYTNAIKTGLPSFVFGRFKFRPLHWLL
jgi:hypothetical protein